MHARLRTYLTFSMHAYALTGPMKWKSNGGILAHFVFCANESYGTECIAHTHVNAVHGATSIDGKLEIKLDDMHWLDAFIYWPVRVGHTSSIFTCVSAAAHEHCVCVQKPIQNWSVTTRESDGWNRNRNQFNTVVPWKSWAIYSFSIISHHLHVSKWCSYQPVIHCNTRACTKGLRKVSSSTFHRSCNAFIHLYFTF